MFLIFATCDRRLRPYVTYPTRGRRASGDGKPERPAMWRAPDQRCPNCATFFYARCTLTPASGGRGDALKGAIHLTSCAATLVKKHEVQGYFPAFPSGRLAE